MGSLPTIKRFLSEDYPTQESWISPLIYALNQLLSTVYSNLNNGITLSQNCLAQVKTLSISGSSPTTSFNWSFSSIQAPVGCVVVQCLPNVTSAATCSWSYSAGVISINNVTGLTAGQTYSVTFIVFGG
jgi:hypothetical protein